jgi:hypothetical protein
LLCGRPFGYGEQAGEPGNNDAAPHAVSKCSGAAVAPSLSRVFIARPRCRASSAQFTRGAFAFTYTAERRRLRFP